MKPRTRKSSYLTRQLEELEATEFPASDQRYKREQKKLLKRVRKKQDRSDRRRELRDMIEEDK